MSFEQLAVLALFILIPLLESMVRSRRNRSRYSRNGRSHEHVARAPTSNQAGNEGLAPMHHRKNIPPLPFAPAPLRPHHQVTKRVVLPGKRATRATFDEPVSSKGRRSHKRAGGSTLIGRIGTARDLRAIVLSAILGPCRALDSGDAPHCPSLRTLSILAALLMCGTPAYSQRAEPVPDGSAAADFTKRVQVYVELRSDLDQGAAHIHETPKPEAIMAAQKTLAARIQTARASARQGDMFTPTVQARFRQLLKPELHGTRGQNTRGIIWDEGPGPGAVLLKVNGEYPKNQPLGSVPANILAALPPLPDGIEYRFVFRHLVLRDARANLIIDYMAAAIPPD